MPHRIHVIGAAGSGTTTLGRALASALALQHLDTDDFFWRPTNPPYTSSREPAERIKLLQAAMDEAERETPSISASNSVPGWVVSGSLCNWGDMFIPRFTRVIFTYLDQATRMERLLARERQRHGTAIEPDGIMHAGHLEFIAWAKSYDTVAPPELGIELHEAWLRRLTCPVLRVDTIQPNDELVEQILAAIADTVSG